MLEYARIVQLLAAHECADSMTTNEIKALGMESAAEKLIFGLGLDGYAIVKYIDTMPTPAPMSHSDFRMKYCNSDCGDMVDMVLSGIHNMDLHLYNMIPDLSDDLFALARLSCILSLLNIH